MDDVVRHIVIVGGGTAGWLTAGLLAADHCAGAENGLRVTVIESPDVPTIGVGEGTWPSLRDTLRRIGIGETEFLRRCQASFKQGSRFDGWVDGSEDDVYFHPFEAPPSADEIDPYALWRAAPAGQPFAAAVCHQPALCVQGKAPKQTATPEYAAVANYAYHLDAGAFAELLREHCTTRLGIELIEDTVQSVETDEYGSVDHLTTGHHGNVTGDLYVDCTGHRALLIGDAMDAPLTDVSDILFNDHALALQVPYRSDHAPIEPQTIGTAMPAGWVWDIGLQTRRGVGHVFSSAHMSEEDARGYLTGYLQRTVPGTDLTGGDARLISFRSAYRQTPWVRNVIGIGMAQGFVEPLEASAIVMIELSATMLSDTLPPRTSLMQVAARRFNERFAYRWERIVDFLKLHYILSKRPEPYWQNHRDRSTWPDRLAELVDRWRYETPSREDFPQAREIFPASSYAYVLYGMGFVPEHRPYQRRSDSHERAEHILAEISERTRKYLQGLPATRELIQHVNERGLSRI